MKDLTPIELLKSLMNSHNLTIKDLCLELKINVKDLSFYLKENEKNSINFDINITNKLANKFKMHKRAFNRNL